MLQSLTPSRRSVARSWRRKAPAWAEVRRSGSVTISSSGVPPRLKLTEEVSAPARRPPGPPCTSLAASSSRCARVMPTANSPSGDRTLTLPPTQIGSSYWEIW